MQCSGNVHQIGNAVKVVIFEDTRRVFVENTKEENARSVLHLLKCRDDQLQLIVHLTKGLEQVLDNIHASGAVISGRGNTVEDESVKVTLVGEDVFLILRVRQSNDSISLHLGELLVERLWSE